MIALGPWAQLLPHVSDGVWATDVFVNVVQISPNNTSAQNLVNTAAATGVRMS